MKIYAVSHIERSRYKTYFIFLSIEERRKKMSVRTHKFIIHKFNY
jgi:hypothetical protein